MFKRGIAFVVSLVIIASVTVGITMCGSKVSAKTSFDENNIVLRFPALSDTHVSNAGGEADEKWKNAIEQLKKYGNMDAMMIGGDFTDYGQEGMVKAFCDTLTKNVDLDQTRLILAMGNHELFDHELNHVDFKVNEFLKKYLGDKYENGASEEDFDACRYHTVVNGIHMLAISCFEYNSGVKFRQEDLDWLDRELAKTSKTSPVFVTMHPMMHGNQWGSDSGAYWATQDDTLINIYKKYPQCVVFSGHMHFPLNDERSIHQDGFTSVGTASVYYASLAKEDADGTAYSNMSGYGFADCHNFSQGILVEVDKNGATRMTRMDFFNKTTIKDPWIIPAPTADGSQNTVYTTEARSTGNTAPAFPTDVTTTSSKASGNSKALDISFTRASDDDMVLDYTITFYDKKTDAAIKSVVLYNDFIKKQSSDDKTISYKLAERNLYPFSCEYANDYYYTVVARDSFGLKSQPTKSQTFEGTGIVKEPIIISETPNKNWKYKLYTNFNKFSEGYELGTSDYNSWPSPSMDTAAKHPAMAKNGWQSSIGLTTKIKSTASYFDVIFTNSGKGFKNNLTGGEEFWMWIDASDVSFKSCYTGFRVDSGYGDGYYTSNWKGDSNMCYYTLADGASTWEKKSFKTDGTFDLSNFKGFVRFDADYLYKQFELYPDNLQAFVFGFTPKDDSQIDKEFVIDQIGFAGPDVKDPDGTVEMLLNGEQFDKKQAIPSDESSDDSSSESSEAESSKPESSTSDETSTVPTTSSVEDTSNTSNQDVTDSTSKIAGKTESSTADSSTSTTNGTSNKTDKVENAKTGHSYAVTGICSLALLALGGVLVVRKKQQK